MSDWYYRNRDKILADKRKQYREDKEFRERKKEQTLDHYYKLKQQCDLVLTNVKLKRRK